MQTHGKTNTVKRYIIKSQSPSHPRPQVLFSRTAAVTTHRDQWGKEWPGQMGSLQMLCREDGGGRPMPGGWHGGYSRSFSGS